MDRLLPWLRRSGWAYLAAGLVLAAVAWRLGAGGGDERAQPAAAAPATVERARAPRQLVHVAGEVRDPGVYRVRAGARVVQAVELAGGPTRRADMSALNLAAELTDGQQVLIPRRVPAGSAAAATAAGGAPGLSAAGPISLASATVEQLDTIDGIGPITAQRIVDWRDTNGGFASIEQLMDVPGIGPGRLEAMRPFVVP